MATSGTIGQTTFTVAQLLDHAFRRCGVPPSKITPEDEQAARESLFAFMLGMSSRGINLWCVEKKLLALKENKSTYVLPDGTLNVLNWVHSAPTEATVDATTLTATTIMQELDEATQIVRYGFKVTASVTASMIFAGSDDDVTYTTIQTLASDTWVAGQWYWYDLDPLETYTYFKVTASGATTFTDLFLASSVRDIKISPWNRDDWTNQPDKNKTGNPATNVYFEKLTSPQFTLWPVPDDDENHVSIWRHRQIEDVGALTNSLDIPTRWLEEILWQFSFRIACEVPGAGERLQFLQQMADKFQIEVEASETDNAPIYIQPNIRGYTS